MLTGHTVDRSALKTALDADPVLVAITDTIKNLQNAKLVKRGFIGGGSIVSKILGSDFSDYDVYLCCDCGTLYNKNREATEIVKRILCYFGSSWAVMEHGYYGGGFQVFTIPSPRIYMKRPLQIILYSAGFIPEKEFDLTCCELFYDQDRNLYGNGLDMFALVPDHYQSKKKFHERILKYWRRGVPLWDGYTKWLGRHGHIPTPHEFSGSWELVTLGISVETISLHSHLGSLIKAFDPREIVKARQAFADAKKTLPIVEIPQDTVRRYNLRWCQYEQESGRTV